MRGFCRSRPVSVCLEASRTCQVEKSKFPCFKQLGFVEKQSSLVSKTRIAYTVVNSGVLTTVPNTSKACCISGILNFDLKVKWQVCCRKEQYVARKAQCRFP